MNRDPVREAERRLADIYLMEAEVIALAPRAPMVGMRLPEDDQIWEETVCQK